MSPNNIANIQLQITPARLDIQQKPAEMNIKQAPADLEIDYTALRSSLGYQKPLDFQVSFSQDSQNTVHQGIDRRVNEGKLLEQQVGKHGSFRELVKQEEQKDLGSLELVYIQPVKINVTISPPKVSVNLGGVKTNYVPGEVHIVGTNLDVKS